MAPKTKTSNFKELMKDPNKKAGDTDHVLARLFREILATHGIGSTQFENLMDKYYRKLHTNRHGQVDLVKVNQDKSNLTRALSKDRLPWYRFETALQIIGPRSFTFTVTMDVGKGLTYKRSVKVPNRYSTIPPDEEVKDGEKEE